MYAVFLVFLWYSLYNAIVRVDTGAGRFLSALLYVQNKQY